MKSKQFKLELTFENDELYVAYILRGWILKLHPDDEWEIGQYSIEIVDMEDYQWIGPAKSLKDGEISRDRILDAIELIDEYIEDNYPDVLHRAMMNASDD